MSEQTGELVVATLFLVTGSVILLNLNTLAEFDQSSGTKIHGWFKKLLGADSIWNRELYSVGTPSGFRRSKLGFGIAGATCLLSGIVSLSLWLIHYLR